MGNIEIDENETCAPITLKVALFHSAATAAAVVAGSNILYICSFVVYQSPN